MRITASLKCFSIGRELTSRDLGIAGARGSMGGMMGGGMMGMGGQTPAYDIMTINGKAYPATEPLRVRKGERVRLRLINASADHTHVIRLAGHRLKVTHTDGNPLVQPVEVDAVPIAPSERYDVLFVAESPGSWFLYCAEAGHPGAGEQVAVVSEGHEGRTPEAPIEGITDLSLWRYGTLELFLVRKTTGHDDHRLGPNLLGEGLVAGQVLDLDQTDLFA